jgi:nucleolar GTP-binding protein
LENP